jgi:hypothetical protein
MISGNRRQAADQCGTGSVASRMDDPRAGVGRFESQPQPPVGSAVEYGTQCQQLVYPVGPFIGEDANGFGIGHAVAGSEGIGSMLSRAVARSQGHRDAALRPRTRTIGQSFLRNHNCGDAFRC